MPTQVITTHIGRQASRSTPGTRAAAILFTLACVLGILIALSVAQRPQQTSVPGVPAAEIDTGWIVGP